MEIIYNLFKKQVSLSDKKEKMKREYNKRIKEINSGIKSTGVPVWFMRQWCKLYESYGEEWFTNKQAAVVIKKAAKNEILTKLIKAGFIEYKKNPEDRIATLYKLIA